jgi:DNA-binding transcriptional ArsR family regulator
MKRPADVCDVFCSDEEKVARVKEKMAHHDCTGLSQWFKALADETRLKIALALHMETELCVCDAALVSGASVAAASHHLRLLRDFGIARHRREGKLVFYSLADRRFARMLQAIGDLTKQEKPKGESGHVPAR